MKRESRKVISEFIARAYRLYPKKMGKARGVKRLESQLKTEADCRNFFTALQRFTKYHETKATEPDFIPYFSTFTSSWQDWLDEDAGVCIEFKKNYDDLFKNIPGGEKLERDNNEPGRISGGDELGDHVLRWPDKI